MKVKNFILVILLLVSLLSCKVNSKPEVVFAVNDRLHNVGYFTDSKGNVLFKQRFQHVISFSDGMAAVEKDDKWGFINSRGKLVVPFDYDIVRNFSDGSAPVMIDDKWGFVNTSGELVIPCIYDGARSFHDGMAAVKIGGRWGFINSRGELVIPFDYYLPSFFTAAIPSENSCAKS